MATANTLTPRQKQLQELLDKGKTPREIAKALKITENAVYQQLRRMRGSQDAPAKAKNGSARKSTTKSKQRSRSRSRSRPAAQASPEPRSMTPLQAIRHRRGEIEGKLSDNQRTLEQATAALNKAQEAYDEAKAKSADELRSLELAEKAIKGELPKTARSRSRSQNGKAETKAPEPEPQPAAEEPAAAETAPPEPAAEPEPALVGAEEGQAAHEHNPEPVFEQTFGQE